MSGPRPATIKPHLVRVNGLELAVQVEGDGDALLLINGMTRPLGSWRPFASELSGHRLISFDVPGVGGSPAPVLPLSIPALAALATSVLDAVRVDKADVLGYSHGGAVAQQFAHDAPGRLDRLILVSTSCGVGSTPGNRKAVLRGLQAAGARNSWPTTDAWGLLWPALAFSSWSSIPFLGSISAPTLVVCGSHDRVVPPDNSRVLARRIPRASLVVMPGGHDLQRPESAEALALIVEEYLRTTPSSNC
ncbi:MAG: alpha/beta fold hydrolase [Acidimicrobiales bacterium]